MSLFNESLKNNALKTRADYAAALTAILDPVYQTMAAQGTPGRFHLSDSGSVYDRDRRDIEGFMRTLWGVGPLCSTPQRAQTYQKYFKAATAGILAGCDSKSPYYWGELHAYDQLFVEMGSLATMLILTKDSFWDRLPAQQQDNIYQWLDQINHHTIPKTNWLFFRILVNTFFQRVGRPASSQQLRADLTEIDRYYLADGWYFDGYPQQIDYYIPFGMQYYGVLYAALSQDQQDDHSQIFADRAGQFARTFANWFTNSGAALPFGRSLTYRFAQSGFWAATAFAKVPLAGVSLAEAKYLLLNNMRHWLQQPIFTSEGFLSIGYGYPNLVMAEGYNAPGSPYWALKNFIILALPDNDDFWQVAEQKPFFPERQVNPYAHMLLIHGHQGDELQVFTAGQHSHEHAHGESKYEKYVYSTTFGFSVKKGSVLPKQGAFDNTLAVSESEINFQTAFGYEEYQTHEQYVYSLWRPWPDVTIRNFMIPFYPWHLRVHVIESSRQLFLREGSFSCPWNGLAGHEVKAPALPNGCFYDSPVGVTGIVPLSAGFSAELSLPEPNTNLLYPETALPLIKGQLAPGQHVVITACLGAAFEHEADLELADINVHLDGSILSGELLGHSFSLSLVELAK
ncbi:DUF2264 domain-containing protein [Lapidilactobacillus luobeiensis]|uniref:DUF2264 domain-containing protein n=1 Tax=Lapidilactobacillus luobeiensis TaxID=2950371 RepID=UPI0021C25F72|nr:DUF2264 domain-containing protein [Lapidilactobacillus luobeiensis]